MQAVYFRIFHCYVFALMTAKEPRISPAALTEVEAALRNYAREVLRAELGEMSTNMYIDKADYFVRWLKRDFEPGSRNDGQGKRRRKLLVGDGPD